MKNANFSERLRGAFLFFGILSKLVWPTSEVLHPALFKFESDNFSANKTKSLIILLGHLVQQGLRWWAASHPGCCYLSTSVNGELDRAAQAFYAFWLCLVQYLNKMESWNVEWWAELISFGSYFELINSEWPHNHKQGQQTEWYVAYRTCPGSDGKCHGNQSHMRVGKNVTQDFTPALPQWHLQPKAGLSAGPPFLGRDQPPQCLGKQGIAWVYFEILHILCHGKSTVIESVCPGHELRRCWEGLHGKCKERECNDCHSWLAQPSIAPTTPFHGTKKNHKYLSSLLCSALHPCSQELV